MMNGKKFRRNKEEKIERVQDVFFRLVQENGYHNTSTNHVAEKAGVSIGTVYKYFPGGKEDIVKSYFDRSMEAFFEKEDLSRMTNENVREVLGEFITALVTHHEKHLGYNIAFRSAMQSDDELQGTHVVKVKKFFTRMATVLRASNENFGAIPEDALAGTFVFMYNLVNAVVYHHLVVMSMFETNEKLVDYLTELVAFSLKYMLGP